MTPSNNSRHLRREKDVLETKEANDGQKCTLDGGGACRFHLLLVRQDAG